MKWFIVILKDGERLEGSSLEWDYKQGSKDIIYLILQLANGTIAEIPYHNVSYILHSNINEVTENAKTE